MYMSAMRMLIKEKKIYALKIWPRCDEMNQAMEHKFRRFEFIDLPPLSRLRCSYLQKYSSCQIILSLIICLISIPRKRFNSFNQEEIFECI